MRDWCSFDLHHAASPQAVGIPCLYPHRSFFLEDFPEMAMPCNDAVVGLRQVVFPFSMFCPSRRFFFFFFFFFVFFLWFPVPRFPSTTMVPIAFSPPVHTAAVLPWRFLLEPLFVDRPGKIFFS